MTRAQVGTYLTVAAAITVVLVGWLRGEEPASMGPGALRAGAGAETTGIYPVAAGELSISTSGQSRPERSIVVHVAGAVRSPGIYRLPADARIASAIAKAGGPSRAARPGSVNLAARLTDEQQVLVPSRFAGDSGIGAADAPVSLGSATTADLEEIDGIGPVTAEKILDYRDQHGGVASIDDLDAVSGVGPATLETLRDEMIP